MRQIYLTLLLAVMSLFTSQTASAYDFEVDGVYYNLNTYDASATVTFGNNPYIGHIDIPATVSYKGRTLEVKRIGDWAFRDCKQLIEVLLPQSIIGFDRYDIFRSCTNLKRVVLSDNISEIGSDAFTDCINLQEINLPKKLKRIDSHAFGNCKSLKNIIFPDSLKFISDWAFQGCESLETIVIPNSVQNIGDHAFYDCKSLSEATIGNGIVSIEEDLFRGCNNLKFLKLGDGITSVGRDADPNLIFCDLPNLSTVILGNNIVKIYYAFRNCPNLSSIAIPKSVTRIEGSFSGCVGLKKLIFEDGADPLYISNYSFQDDSIQNLYIGRRFDEMSNNFYFPTVKTLKVLSLANFTSSVYFDNFSFQVDSIKIVNSYCTDPTLIQLPLSSTVYINATLYVPAGTKEKYMQTDGWKNFFTIQEMDEETTSIASTTIKKEKDIIGRYNASGQRLNTPQKGINIIKYSDGTTQKVIIK